MSTDHDPGPPPEIADLFERLPSYGEHADLFWHDWGPVFYRGRLDRSARLLVLASDPGPTERIAGRSLVGNAGQRVQGFLTKVGLTRSYVCLNAYAYATLPSRADEAARTILRAPEHTRWRNELFDAVTGPDLQAIVAFGAQARDAFARWENAPNVPVHKVPHPSSRDPKALLDAWRDAVSDLRGVVTPDPDGDPTVPTYGAEFEESDYAPIPRGDLPYGMPAFYGDDAWIRALGENGAVQRPRSDPAHTIEWRAPGGEG
jgi:uracil-DNA glycosylase